MFDQTTGLLASEKGSPSGGKINNHKCFKVRMPFEPYEGSAVDFVYTRSTKAHNLNFVYKNFLTNRAEAGVERC